MKKHLPALIIGMIGLIAGGNHAYGAYDYGIGKIEMSPVQRNDQSKLAIEITPAGNSIEFGKPISINISIKNVSQHDVHIPTFNDSGNTAYLYLGMFVIDFNISRMESNKEIRVPTIRPFQIYKTLPAPGNKVLKPGAAWNVMVDLRLWLSSAQSSYVTGKVRNDNESGSAGGNLKAGEYKIQALYDIRPWINLTNNSEGYVGHTFTSNSLRMAVE